jgi:hypothetical protein
MNNLANNTDASSPPEPSSRLELIGQLRTCLIELMPDAETLWNQSNDSTIAFRGHLTMDADQAYATLRECFAERGYTPLLRRQKESDVVIAIHQAFAPQRRTHWAINLILFLLTLCTTTLMGALIEQGELLLENPRLLLEQPGLLLTGLPAALTIMGILGVHELAHYFVARRHGLDSSLPFFIPMPFSPVGTMGAIIRIRAPWASRKALFDVGIAGPVAGLVVALPIFFFGLLTSPVLPPQPNSVALGSPLLLRWMENLVHVIRQIPPGHDIYVNAVAYFAWFGVIITGYNLMPIGQLDGGHVIYALLGRWAQVVGIITLIAMFTLGALVWNGWYVWAALIMFTGWRHPPPLNTVAPLGTTRTVVGILLFLLTILLVTPIPQQPL